MSNFPIEKSDDEGIVDGINYLLSGPAGLGQNFSGFSSYEKAYLTGNYRTPYSIPSTILTFRATVYPYPADRHIMYVNGDVTDILMPGMYVNNILPPTPSNQIVSVDGYSGGVTQITLLNEYTPITDEIVYFSSYIQNLYVAPIDISTVEFVDDKTIKVVFTYTQPTVPFVPGNPVILSGVSGDSYWNGRYTTIGVINCTNTECYIRINGTETGILPGSGGTISLSVTNSIVTIAQDLEYTNSTDCNARVTVTGASDRVFISAQLDCNFRINSFVPIGESGSLDFIARINRYYGIPNDNQNSSEIVFVGQTTISEKTYSYGVTFNGGSFSIDNLVFSTIVDSPGPGYYWYILELYFMSSERDGVTDAEVQDLVMGLRSLSAQVVKQ